MKDNSSRKKFMRLPFMMVRLVRIISETLVFGLRASR